MQNNGALVLDVCCSTRAFWFDSQYPNAVYCDRRVESIDIQPNKAYPNGGKYNIFPDVQCDFTALPFKSDFFSMVVFDPPHMKRKVAKGALTKRYGVLDDNWRIMIRNGFSECFRVLRPDGFLIFKWAETEVTIKDVLSLTNYKPLFGHKSGKQMKTHWITFTKPNNRLHLTAFGDGGLSEIPLQASMFAEVSPATFGGR